jgi:spermidine/putrescine ABC transporter ATP-binding subunit
LRKVNPEPVVAAHLSVRRLHKAYGQHAAVAGVDLDVATGEFVALLGPSGSGKTTLLRAIAGLVVPDDGDILIDGRPILHVPIHRRDLGMVFQSYALFPHLTVAGNVAFGLRMRGCGAQEAAGRVADALELVRLAGMEARYPHQLSGGQQQRVALARALVTNPTVLLLDEPLAALDAKLREAMQIELRQLQRKLRVTTIFVTHDQHEAMSMADRIAVMRDGKVEQFGTPAAIYDDPRTSFVAEFIGQMNRIRGQIVSFGNGRVEVRIAGNGVLAGRSSSPLQPGECVAMMRPEKLDVVPMGSACAGAHNRVLATIADVVFTGAKISFFLDSAAGPLIATMQNKSAGAALPAVGASVELRWRAADTLVFADEAGAADASSSPGRRK